MEVGASYIALSVPPPSSSPARCGGGGGEPGGARVAVSAPDIAEKTLHMGRASPGSATEGGAATGGASAGGREGGWFSCPLSPINPEPPRLSTRTGRPPPLPGRPLDPSGGGRGVPYPGQSGRCWRPAAAGAGATQGHLAGGSGGGSGGTNQACRTLDEAAAPATATGCPS